jgi:hypothetical protein
LLKRHQGDNTIRLLQRLAQDPEPAVAAVALARLIEIDPQLVVPTVQQVLANADAKVRSLGVEVLRRRPTEKHVGLLAVRLDDTHPDVRVQARRALYELAAKPEFRGPVIADGTRVLAAQDWRGLEQAAILLTQLDHKPAAGRLVELLTFDRPEVFATAAWGLRKLAVKETLPEVTRHVEAQLKRVRAVKAPSNVPIGIIDHQLSQLNQFLGREKYQPADAVLRQFVPKRPDTPMFEARAAAVWALGLIHEGKTEPALAKDLEVRLNDIAAMPPEDPRVRWMSAVTLGRLRAKEALPSLRKYFLSNEWSLDRIGNACGWAVVQLTGEAVPPPKPIRIPQRDWFLSPFEP